MGVEPLVMKGPSACREHRLAWRGPATHDQIYNALSGAARPVTLVSEEVNKIDGHRDVDCNLSSEFLIKGVYS
jgi:hypothetical protein